jgi:hypothetical protein
VVVIDPDGRTREVLAQLTPGDRSVIEVDPRFAGSWCDPA